MFVTCLVENLVLFWSVHQMDRYGAAASRKEGRGIPD